MTRLGVLPDRTSWCAVRRIAIILLVYMSLPIGLGSDPHALGNSALLRINAACESKFFTLKVALHEPDTSSDTMQASTLEKNGWHHHNPNGPVAIDAGSRVEVTGVFNYSERGFFLEVAREASGMTEGDIASRPRSRIRFVVEAGGADQNAQTREAFDLIGKVLSGVLDGTTGVE